MEYVFFWIVFAVIVGVAANTRGRSGLGWFALAVIISPLLSGLLLLALPRGKPDLVAVGPPNNVEPPAPVPVFEPDGVYAGIPYKVLTDGGINALMSGTFVRFRTLDEFRAAADGATRQFDRR